MTEGVFVAEAPTKIILSGEHSVVYGYPALVLAVEPKVRAEVRLMKDKVVRVKSQRLGTAELDLSSGAIQGDQRLTPMVEVLRHVLGARGFDSGLVAETFSDAPVAAGMGSSASAFVSVALATYQALGAKPSKKELFDAAMVGERSVHGKPSGVDVEVAISGGIMRYSKGEGSSPISLGSELPLLVINTGLERRTGDMVEKFRSSLESGGKEMQALLEAIGEVTFQLEGALLEGNLSLVGRLMTANHVLLSRFGVSAPMLDLVVASSVMCGALGAKLTGAGGGGSAIALAPQNVAPNVAARMNKMGLTSFPAKSCFEGGRAWSS